MSKSYSLEGPTTAAHSEGGTFTPNDEHGGMKIPNSRVEPDTGTKDGGDKETKKETPVMVGMAEVFRFATPFDRMLVIGGVLSSCIHGAMMPLMMIIFGDMTNTFVDDGQFNNFWDEFGEQIESIFNISKEAILNDPSKLMVICEAFNQTAVCDELMNKALGDFLDKMTGYSINYIILGLVSFVISYLQLVCWNLSAYNQTQRVRTRLFQAILRQDIGWFDTHAVGELNTRLADDVSKIQEGLGEKLGMFFQWFCSFLAGFVVGFVHGWKLTLVILAVSPLLAISGGIVSKIGAAFTTKELSAYAKAGAVAEEVLGAVRTVVAFGGEQKECDRYDRNLVDAMRFGVRKGLANGGGIGLVFLVMFSSYALAFWYGAQLVQDDPAYTAGTLITVFFSVLIGAFSIGNAAPNLQYFATARGAAHVIYNIIDLVPPIDSSSDEGIELPNLIGNIEFRNVFFKYPSRPDTPVLQGLNLKVQVGQTVALVGASGCGKSTTVQLIQRFYDPHEGQVFIDDVDICSLNLKWLRKNIGVVSQEPVLFGTTIDENIRYGRDDVTHEEIVRAARKANAHDFIMDLPKKYQTLVGERGAQLSGGQKQRIAITRALVRDPKILLLDEATSALDTESEASVQTALDKARLGRTTVVIAHRLSTIRTADLIAGFDEGAIAEQGSHDELMKLGGIYHTLVMNQTGKETKEEGGDRLDDDDDMEVTKEGRIRHTSAGTRGSFRRMTSVSSGKARTLSVTSDKPEEEEEENLSPPSLKRIIRLNAPEWYFIVIGCLAAIVSGSIQPVFAIIFSEIITVFAELDPDELQRKANFYSAMFVVIGVVAAIAMFLQSSLFALSGEKLTLRLRQMAFKAMLRQEIGWFDDRHHSVGALTTRLATDASAVKGATGSQLAVVLQSFASIGIGLAIGFSISAKLSAVILAFAPLMLIAGFVQTKTLMGHAAKDKELLENAGKVAVETIENIRTVASLTKENHFNDQYKELTGIPYKQNKRGVHFQGLAFGFSQGIIFFAYAACFRYGSHLVRNEGLPFTDMFKVFSAIVFSAMSVGQASSFAPDYSKAKHAASLLFTIFDRTPLIDSSDMSGAKPDEVQGVVNFESVQFNYPMRPDVQVLRGLTVEVNPGETLALVGPSGCGKSTSVQLLERFYDPASGTVKLDSVDVRQLQLKWLRSQMGIVSQEPVLFDCSIRENICYGDNSRQVSMDEVIAAARKANIHDFITSIPEGYETNVGDKGTQLSGGQKQRVAIARALIRNPKVLLLDEATSALDTESEKVVQEALDRARAGRTCIVIAHRLSTIYDADRIAVIRNGVIKEYGTHSELMELHGLYYRLNTAQQRQV